MHAVRAGGIATLLLVVTVALWGAAAASSESQSAKYLRFSSYPKRTLPGKTASLSIIGPEKGDVCRLEVKYAAGPFQPGLPPLKMRGGSGTWKWTVPRSTKPGAAHATV